MIESEYENNYILSAIEFVRSNGDRLFLKADGNRSSFKYTARIYGVRNRFSSEADPKREALSIDQESPQRAIDAVLRNYIRITGSNFVISHTLSTDGFLIGAFDYISAHGDLLLVIGTEPCESLPYNIIVGGCRHRFEAIDLSGDNLHELLAKALAAYKYAAGE